MLASQATGEVAFGSARAALCRLCRTLLAGARAACTGTPLPQTHAREHHCGQRDRPERAEPERERHPGDRRGALGSGGLSDSEEEVEVASELQADGGGKRDGGGEGLEEKGLSDVVRLRGDSGETGNGEGTAAVDSAPTTPPLEDVLCMML